LLRFKYFLGIYFAGKYTGSGVFIKKKSCGVGDLQRDWYVVYSKPHKEEQAQFHLRMKGLDVFFPRLDLVRVSERRKRVIPLFPNYLFVRIDLETEFHYVTWSPGVKRLVSFGDRPIP